MFEKEVIISGIKKQKEILSELVDELEKKSEFDRQEVDYCQEVLKKAETYLRKIRQVSLEMDKRAHRYSYSFVTRLW